MERSFRSHKSPKTRKKERNVPLKERKRTERTNQKRTRCPTLALTTTPPDDWRLDATQQYNSIKRAGTELNRMLTMNIFLNTGGCDSTGNRQLTGSLQQEYSHSWQQLANDNVVLVQLGVGIGVKITPYRCTVELPEVAVCSCSLLKSKIWYQTLCFNIISTWQISMMATLGAIIV